MGAGKRAEFRHPEETFLGCGQKGAPVVTPTTTGHSPPKVPRHAAKTDLFVFADLDSELGKGLLAETGGAQLYYRKEYNVHFNFTILYYCLMFIEGSRKV